MKLEQSFEVHAPIDVVWIALNDLERVAPCLPGAAITGHDEDGTYHGEFKVKLGPTTAAYRGTIKIESADEATHTATLAAKGSDKRGQGGANATIVNTLHEIEGGTRVDAVTDFSITGRLAAFGRGGMIQDISNKLLRELRDLPGDAAGGARAGDRRRGRGRRGRARGGRDDPAARAGCRDRGRKLGGAPADRGGRARQRRPAARHARRRRPVAHHRAAAAGNEPLKAGSLFWSVLWERIKRVFGGGRK